MNIMSGMNWRTYKTMTSEQKEEWSFRFDRKSLCYDVKQYSRCIMNVGMFYVFMFSLDSRFKEMYVMMYSMFSQISQFVIIFMFLIFLGLLIDIGRMCYQLYKEKKWMCDNNIKYLAWYNKKHTGEHQ